MKAIHILLFLACILSVSCNKGRDEDSGFNFMQLAGKWTATTVEYLPVNYQGITLADMILALEK